MRHLKICTHTYTHPCPVATCCRRTPLCSKHTHFSPRPAAGCRCWASCGTKRRQPGRRQRLRRGCGLAWRPLWPACWMEFRCGSPGFTSTAAGQVGGGALAQNLGGTAMTHHDFGSWDCTNAGPHIHTASASRVTLGVVGGPAGSRTLRLHSPYKNRAGSAKGCLCQTRPAAALWRACNALPAAAGQSPGL